MSLVARLDWDSELFGFEIGRVAAGTGATALPQAAWQADQMGLRCVYLLVPAAEADTLDTAQRLGFVVRDVRVELERPVAGHPASLEGLRRARAEDLDALEPIVRERFVTTRFFADPGFPRERSAELYARWLRLGLEPADGLHAGLVNDDESGVIVCKLDREEAVGHVDLIAVASAAEGRGAGGRLIEGAGALFAEAGARTAHVVTQGANVAAQRLYQRFGYRTSATSIWLHRWADPVGG